MAAARANTAARVGASSLATFFTCSAMRGLPASCASCFSKKSQYSVVKGQALSPVRCAGS